MNASTRKKLAMMLALQEQQPTPGHFVNYLEGTGTQYIDTGLNYRTLYTFTLSFYVDFVPTSGTVVLCGIYTDKTSSSRGQIVKFTSQSSYTCHDLNSYSFSPGNSCIPGTNYVATFTNQVFSSYMTMYLFARNNDQGVYIPTEGFRYTEFKAVVNSTGTTALLLKPYVDDNGVPCMYDTVSSTCHYNIGTGTFLYG